MNLAALWQRITRRGDSAAQAAPVLPTVAHVPAGQGAETSPPLPVSLPIFSEPKPAVDGGAAVPAASQTAVVSADLAEALIAKHEGFRSTAYRCAAGVWSIGYGTTRYGDGRAVWAGADPISEPDARRLLRADMRTAERAVDDLVTVPLNPNQRAALVSLTYNIGRRAFSASTLLAQLNAGKMHAAAGEFLRWNKGGGKVLHGLVKRRAEESALFMRAP